jgi:hypothetical protein
MASNPEPADLETHIMKNLFISVVLSMGTLSAPALHADATSMGDGVLVDREAARAFFSDAAGFARSISLPDGAPRWISQDSAFPLIETQGKLVALGRIDVKGVGLLLILDAETGNVLDRVAFDVPESVAASAMPSPKSTFTVQAQATPAGARIHWQHQGKPHRGAYIESDGDVVITEGVFDLHLSASRNLTVPVTGPVDPVAAPTPDLAANERIASLGGRQFRGVDDAAVLATEAVADPLFGTLWRWTVRARGANRNAGSLTSPYAFAPFALIGDTLIYRAEAVAWRDADGREHAKGPRLVGHDLASGNVRWEIDALETHYRGPMPP